MKCYIACVIAVFLAVGCGPTNTVGTHDLKKADLAVMTIHQHNAFPGFHISAVKIEGERFEIDGNRDFYLTPGDHKLEVGLGQCVHGPQAWFSPMGDLAFFVPSSTGALAAGKRYQLRDWQAGLSLTGAAEFVSNIAVEAPK